MKTTITQNQIFRTFSRLQRSCFSAVFLLTFLLSASSSWGQIAQRGSATTAISTSASVTVSKPTGVVAGDIMIANIGNYIQATQTSASCTGWTVIAGTDTDRGRATLLYKIAGGSEPNSYTFSVTASSSAATGAIVAFSGVDNTTPFDVTAPTSWYTANSGSLSNVPGLTSVSNGSAILLFGNCSRITSTTSSNFTSWSAVTSPTSFTEIYDAGHNSVGNTPAVGAAWAIKSATGATGLGGLACTPNTNPRTMGGIMLALRPSCVFAITAQSTAAQSKCINSAFSSISVTTAGTGLTYQWYHNNSASTSGGTSLGAANGAQTATYTPQSDVAGTKYYYCIVTKSCGSLTSNVSGAFTVTNPPSAGTLSGTQAICSNGTTTFTTNGTSGGTWSSGFIGVATINSSTGVITPVNAGTTTMTYSVAGTGGCTNTSSATRTVTVTAAPSAGTLSGTNTLCSNGNTTLSSTISGGAWSSSNDAVATINSSTGIVSGVSAGTATMTYTVTGTGGCANATATINVTVNPIPSSVSASTSASTICGSGSVNLTSSATSNSSTAASILSENFNSTISTWTLGNASSGGNVSNAAWTQRTSGYNDGNETFTTPDASQFIMSNSDLQGSGGTTNTSLTTSFSTTGLNAANIILSHYYRYNSGTDDRAYVEVSTNGTAWTTLVTYSATQGSATAFASPTIALTAGFLNQATVYLRFRYTGSYDWYWAINSVSLSGTYTSAPAATFAWTSSPSGFTTSTQNPTGVSPTSTTTYTVTATNNYGCTATASTTVSLNSVTAGSIGSAQTICSGGNPAAFTSTAGTGSGTITYRWESNTNLSTPSWSTVASQTAATYDVPSGLTTTTQYRRITISTLNSVACESAATAAVQVTVNPILTASVSIASNDANNTICSGTSVTFTATPTNGGTPSYVWKKNGTTISGATTATYTSTTLANGDKITCVMTSNASPCLAGSPATSNEVTMVVNALPGSATSSNVTLCGTGSVTLTATNPGAEYTINWYNAAQDTQLATASLTYTTPSLSTTTTYYAEMENTTTGCKSENRTAVQAIVNATNSYTGGVSGTNTDWFTAGNWSCGSVPNATSNVLIPTGKVISISYLPNQGPAYSYSVTLQGTASLTVTSGHGINVTNKVTVASGATFTVENNASLVQTNNVANEGNIVVQKSTPSNRLLKRNDAVLWSSPVVQNLQAISTGTPAAYFMQHDPQANSWSAVSSPATADFTKGKGFLIRTPSTFTTTATQQWSVNFTGVPNNGDVTISAGSTGATEKYLLVGNPYPSAISIAAFRTANPNITGVFYFYRKPNGVTSISGYGTLAANGQFSTNDADNLVGALTPGDVIASGQGFFVAMKSDNNNGEVYFTNAMRVANDHGHFNRVNTNLDSYKLIVKTPVGGNSQMIMNYDSETTNGYDVGYDAVAFTDGTTDFSSIMANEKYRIQSKGEYNAADVIPVQFKTGTAGEHRIKLQDAQGVFAADQMVIIKDNLTGVQHNLTANGDYVFTATAGTFTNRFEVIYQQAYYTALQANSCGATIANMSSLVYADIVNGATGYRFKVVNNTTAAVQTIDRPQHWFAFNMLSAYDYNTPYTISVQVQKDGVWTGYYGATCTVNSPNIAATGIMQINPSQCGMTLPTIGTVIATTPLAGATGYKFRITNTTAGVTGTNMVQEITRSNHWFTLGMLARYNYGSSYTVEVAVKTTGGYTPYGNACTVYAPSAPTLTSCGQTVATNATIVLTTPMTAVTQYRFQVTRMSTQETITFDTANYWFSFRVNVPGYAAGEQYGVRVAVMTSGAWSPYGDACDITAPITSARTTEEAAPSEANLFKPVAYPNPFTTSFGISLATPSADVVHIIVYDLQGRLIEKQNVFVSELDGLQIGTNYPSGDYLLVVAQGANIKSSHIHKD